MKYEFKLYDTTYQLLADQVNKALEIAYSLALLKKDTQKG